MFDIGAAVGGAIGGITSIFTNKANIKAQKRQNAENNAFAREMYQKQNTDNIEFWNMQNAYNDPSAQMQRMKDASLNPNLVYGSGTSTQASPIASASAPTWKGEAPKSDLSGLERSFNSIGSLYQIEQQKANINKTNAETWALMNSNKIAETVGTDTPADNILSTLNASIQKNSTEFNQNATKHAVNYKKDDGSYYQNTDLNSPLAKSQKAELQKAVSTLKQIQSQTTNTNQSTKNAQQEAVIKRYRENISKMGGNPDADQTFKFLQESFGKNLGGLGAVLLKLIGK